MIIYKDYVFGFELLSDAFPLKIPDDGTDCFSFTSKQMAVKEGDIDASLIGGNASAEEPQEEAAEASVKRGFDFELRHELEKHEMDKKMYASWFKTYAKKVMQKAEADGKTEKVASVKASAQNFMKKFKDIVGDCDFYSAPAQEVDDDVVVGNCVILHWNDDGVSGTAYCWRGGLQEEKC